MQTLAPGGDVAAPCGQRRRPVSAAAAAVAAAAAAGNVTPTSAGAATPTGAAGERRTSGVVGDNRRASTTKAPAPVDTVSARQLNVIVDHMLSQRQAIATLSRVLTDMQDEIIRTSK